jgi:hypothetical protein
MTITCPITGYNQPRGLESCARSVRSGTMLTIYTSVVYAVSTLESPGYSEVRQASVEVALFPTVLRKALSLCGQKATLLLLFLSISFPSSLNRFWSSTSSKAIELIHIELIHIISLPILIMVAFTKILLAGASLLLTSASAFEGFHIQMHRHDSSTCEALVGAKGDEIGKKTFVGPGKPY